MRISLRRYRRRRRVQCNFCDFLSPSVPRVTFAPGDSVRPRPVPIFCARPSPGTCASAAAVERPRAAYSMKSIALQHRAAINKSCYYGGGYPTDLSGYAVVRCRSPRSPAADDMDDISVGRPSPPASPECYARLHEGPGRRDGNDSDSTSSSGAGGCDDDGGVGSDYFGPLKKLGTVRIDKVSYGISDRKSYAPKRRTAPQQQQQQQQQYHRQTQLLDGGGVAVDVMTMTAAGCRTTIATTAEDAQPAAGVKSFSIADILSHEPNGKQQSSPPPASASASASEDSAKIVRPWAEEYQPPCSSFAPPPPPPPPAHRQTVVGALFPHSLFIQHLQHQQQQQQQHHHHLHHHGSGGLQHRPKSADYETSTCTSGRSSTDGSECCTSPEIASCTQSNPSSSSAAAARKHQAAGKNNDNSSPLDALFQMTSKTFDQLHGDPSTAGESFCLFNPRRSFWRVV